eukprot:GAHX01002299.1.p1 GENE.GAHX01002299.1~~GAHX01002299.1.p1  ORF type:complete len:463 (+),score=44.96 GAHX01002299.1:25-1389(+)
MESATEDAEEGEKRRAAVLRNKTNIMLRCRRNGYLVSCLILALLSGFTYSFNVIETETRQIFAVSNIFLSVLYPLGILALVMASVVVDKIRRRIGLRGSIFIGAIISLIGFLAMGITAHLAFLYAKYQYALASFYTVAYLATNLGLGFGYYMGFKVLVDYTNVRSVTLNMSIFSVMFLSGNLFFIGIKEVFHCKTLHGFFYASCCIVFILLTISLLLLRKPESIGKRRVSNSETSLPDKKRKPKSNYRELNTKRILLCFLLSFFIVGWVQFSYNFNSELIRDYNEKEFESESVKHDFISFLSSTTTLLFIGTTLDILESKNIKNKSLLFILITIVILFCSSLVSIFSPKFMVKNYLSSITIGINGGIFILLPKCFTDYTENKNITMAMGLGDFLGFIGTLMFNVTPSLMGKEDSKSGHHKINCTLFIIITSVCYVLILVMIYILFSKQKHCRKP